MLFRSARKRSDGIYLTARTIINDNPQLNSRVSGENLAKPIYVIDRLLSTPLSARIFETASTLCFFHQVEVNPKRLAALQAKGASCVAISLENGLLALDEIINFIGKAGCHDLLVEAGARCFAALHRANLVSRTWLYLAGKTLGEDAVSAFPMGDNFLAPKNVNWQVYGKDVLCQLEW